jgi:hypothetical protein
MRGANEGGGLRFANPPYGIMSVAICWSVCEYEFGLETDQFGAPRS